MKALIIVTDSEAVPVFERVLAEEREGFTVVPAIIGRGRSGLKAGDRVHPEHRQAVDGLGTAFPIEVLDESFELEGRKIAEKVCDFASKRSRPEDDERIGRIGA